MAHLRGSSARALHRTGRAYELSDLSHERRPPTSVLHYTGPEDPAWSFICAVGMRMTALGIDPTAAENVQQAVTTGRAAYEAQSANVKLRRDEVHGVIYYMRVGNRVKIGFTTGLARRMEQFSPEELLAVEFGTMAIERTRHDKFAELRTTGEWFKFEGPLVEYVQELQAALRA